MKYSALDAIDRKILKELQRDATLSHATLAERVGASSASVWRRVKALEAAEVLGKAIRLVNPARVGLTLNVLCSVRMRDQQARDSFEAFVRGRPEIVTCFSMSGDWDYMLRIVVANIDAFNDLLMRDLLSHPSVANTSSNFVLGTVKMTTELPA